MSAPEGVKHLAVLTSQNIMQRQPRNLEAIKILGTMRWLRIGKGKEGYSYRQLRCSSHKKRCKFSKF